MQQPVSMVRGTRKQSSPFLAKTTYYLLALLLIVILFSLTVIAGAWAFSVVRGLLLIGC